MVKGRKIYFKAYRLLTLNSDHTLQDIAHMVGYSNSNYFGKVFKTDKVITLDKFRIVFEHS